MSSTERDASQDDSRLNEILAGYLQAAESGQPIDREQFIREHVEYADELREFFADKSQIDKLADEVVGKGAIDAPTLPPASVTRLDAPTLDAVATPKAAPRPGAMIRYFGDYELLEEIARGGMGVVYKARQVKLNRVVAIKMILSGQLASKEDVQRFYTEAEAAAGLDHPGIVPIFEVGEHAGQHFFSMGFIDGESLSSRLSAGPLPPREAAELVSKVAEAIQYAHDRGVIHRDLKPANILLQRSVVRSQKSASGRTESSTDLCSLTSDLSSPKVTDFGLAKKSAADSNLTGTGQILGTPSYMPPEQAAGRLSDVRETADVYSLGAILYATLTGRPPFQADNPLDTLMQVLEREPVPPRSLNSKIPLDLETICLKCLEKDRRRRYASARALTEELQRFLDGKAILARPVSAAERGWRLCRRHPATAALTAGIAASLVIGTLVSWSFAMQAKQQAGDARRSEALAVSEKKRADEQAEVALLNAKRADQQAQVAEANAQRADARTKEARRHLYAAHMNLAQSAWEDARVGQTVRLLDQYRPVAGQAGGSDDLRGFEWYYWQRLSHTYRLDLNGHKSAVACVAYSPDGKRLASASLDLTVKVWDVATGQELLTLKGHKNSVLSVAFSPDGKYLASASTDQTVKVWDAATGQDLRTLKVNSVLGHSVAFSPDGKRLAYGGGLLSGEVKLWDLATGQESHTLKGHKFAVTSVAFSPDGNRLASASFDQTVKVWDATSGQETLTLKGHGGMVTSVAFSPDGQRLVSASEDNTVKMWDAATGQESHTLKGHTNKVTSVAFSPDGKQLASASEDQTIKVWDAAAGQEPLTLKGNAAAVSGVQSVAFSPDGQRLAAAGSYFFLVKLGEVNVWDAATGKVSLRLTGHASPVTSVVFSPDGKRLASASEDQTVKVWDAATGQESHTLKGHTNKVTSVAFSPDGKQLASASGKILPNNSGEVKWWDLATGQVLQTLTGHASPVESVAFSLDGQRLASASWDRTVKVWDAATGHELLTLKGHTGTVSSVAFSPDGKRLASASHDNTVKVWDATTGEESLTLNGHTDKVQSVAFSRDGKRLASASDDNTVKVWDAATGQELLTLKEHTNKVTSVAFSADGNRLASASSDGTVKVWDATLRP